MRFKSRSMRVVYKNTRYVSVFPNVILQQNNREKREEVLKSINYNI